MINRAREFQPQLSWHARSSSPISPLANPKISGLTPKPQAGAPAAVAPALPALRAVHAGLGRLARTRTPMSLPMKTPALSRLSSRRFSSRNSASRRFARNRLGRPFRASFIAQSASHHRPTHRDWCLRGSNALLPGAEPRRSLRPVSPPRKIQNA